MRGYGFLGMWVLLCVRCWCHSCHGGCWRPFIVAECLWRYILLSLNCSAAVLLLNCHTQSHCLWAWTTSSQKGCTKKLPRDTRFAKREPREPRDIFFPLCLLAQTWSRRQRWKKGNYLLFAFPKALWLYDCRNTQFKEFNTVQLSWTGTKQSSRGDSVWSYDPSTC